MQQNFDLGYLELWVKTYLFSKNVCNIKTLHSNAILFQN